VLLWGKGGGFVYHDLPLAPPAQPFFGITTFLFPSEGIAMVNEAFPSPSPNTHADAFCPHTGGDPSATATNAMKAIIKAEQVFHAAIDASYATMGDTTFKALRRALPITHMRIPWNMIRNYQVGAEMQLRH